MNVDIAVVPFENEEVLSAKIITGKITRKEARVVIQQALEKIRGDHQIVRIYLYEDEKMKEHGNNYVTAQWTHQDVNEVPDILEDELLKENILVRWNESHDETKQILNW